MRAGYETRLIFKRSSKGFNGNERIQRKEKIYNEQMVSLLV